MHNTKQKCIQKNSISRCFCQIQNYPDWICPFPPKLTTAGYKISRNRLMSHLLFHLLVFFYQIAWMIKKLLQVSGRKSTNQLSIPPSINFYRCRAKKVAAGERSFDRLSHFLWKPNYCLLLLTTTYPHYGHNTTTAPRASYGYGW